MSKVDLIARERARREALADSKSQSPWALLIVVLALVIALVIISTGHWRKGSFAAGCAIGLGGVLRLVLPEKLAGLLVVRSKVIDTVIMIGTGLIMLGLTLIVPHSPPS